MFHIVKQTHDERVAMYMRCRKSELAEMLANRSAQDDAQPWVEMPEVADDEARFHHVDPALPDHQHDNLHADHIRA